MENENKKDIEIIEPVIEILTPKETSEAKLGQLITSVSNPIDKPRRKSKTELSKEQELRLLLTEDDFEFYVNKKETYLASYPELTDPFDLDDLHLMLMEQVTQRNLLKRKKKNPAVNISDAYEKSVKRQLELKKSLNVRRTDRVKTKEIKQTNTVNIADMSVVFGDKNKMMEFEDRLRLLENEEQELKDSKAGDIVE